MSIKVFKTNKVGKIEFTRCELEKLLNETYREGYTDGENHAKSNYWTWTSPSINITSPYYGTTLCDTSNETCSSNASNTVTLTNSNSNDKVITNSQDNFSPIKTIKVDVSANSDKTPKTSTKEETPIKTSKVEDMTYNIIDLIKTADALLNGNFEASDLNGAKKAIENDAFTNLAKELRGI